jgi:hypothetical protein
MFSKWWKDKSRKQIEGIENSFIADDIEYGSEQNTIMVCFGFCINDGV